MEDLGPLFAHPALPPDGGQAAREPPTSAQPRWTLDMDDMLRGAVRRSGFSFEEAAKHIQGYVMRVRTAGGILPDEVVEPLYTPRACRERWAHLDLEACKAFRAAEAAGGASAKSEPAAAAAASSSSAKAAAGGGSDSDGTGDSGSDDDDFGIVDLDALRAQKLGGLFGAPKPKPKKAKGSSQPKPSAPSAAAKAAAATARQLLPEAQAAAASPAAQWRQGQARSSAQLEQLETLAAELKSSTAEAEEGMSAAERGRREAAGTLLQPLGELKQRMAGLEALLNDEATDMAAKLSEVADITRDMADLQSLASRYQPAVEEDDGPNSPRAPVPAGPPPAAAAPVARPAGAPPAADGSPARGGVNAGVNLESALDDPSLDLDGLLARLEAEHAAKGSGNGHAQPADLDALDD